MNILLSLCLAMVAGLLLTRVVKLFHLPNVTGYLIAGLIIGPFGLKFVEGANLKDFEIITTLALGFIAFSIGGEFKLKNIKQIGAKATIITCFEALTAVALVDTALCLYGCPVPMALTLGAISAATAPAATLMVVRQYKAKGPVTNTLLPVVAMDDAVGLMAYALSVSLAITLERHTELTVKSVVLMPLLEIFLSLAIGAVIGVVISVATKFFHSRANRISLVIAAIVGGVAISQIFDLSSLLLCMMIGAVFANACPFCDDILENTDRWTPPVFMLFFVISGAELDFSVLTTVGMVGVLYVVVRSIGKYVGASVGSTIVKSPKTVRKYLGITLLPQAGVAVGMAQMAMTELPEYGAKIRAVVLSAILIYELVGPVLTKISLIKAGEIEKPERKQKQEKVKA